MWPFNKKKKAGARAPRPMIAGTVDVGGLEWAVREEKRGGEQSQILILERDGGRMIMHVRPMPGAEAGNLEDVATLARDATYRFFRDADDRTWEVRIVTLTDPGKTPVRLAKFISGMDVFETRYPFDDGLGLRTDEELINLIGGR